MCHSSMNLMQAMLLGPFLIYEAKNPNPNALRTTGLLIIIYHLYQLYIKGDLIDTSDKQSSNTDSGSKKRIYRK